MAGEVVGMRKLQERETPMRAIRIDYVCTHCGDGNMVSTPFQCHLDGVQHQCDRCGDVAVLGRQYPYVDYVPNQTEPTPPIKP